MTPRDIDSQVIITCDDFPFNKGWVDIIMIDGTVGVRTTPSRDDARKSLFFVEMHHVEIAQ